MSSSETSSTRISGLLVVSQPSPTVVNKVAFIPWHEWWGPAVVYLAAFVLCFNAGFMNGASMAGMYKYGSITSVTGTVAHLGVEFQHGDLDKAKHYGLLLFSFFTGSSICGLYIPNKHVQIGKQRYGYALFNTSLFIVLATYFNNEDFSKCLIAAACGLQNGMASQYSSNVMRTTHVTGTITDLGLAIGRLLGARLRNETGDHTVVSWKIQFLSLELVGFFLGSLTGARLWDDYGDKVMYVPAVSSATLGLTYSVYRYRIKNST
ncbi:hypothetical protein CYMTET_37943 [Cymbomonas tetramitiformis]|uniref:DUF1275 domain protein n=1 Tax=Cymbomonas tetramitiformis TaxID=36881 RepID=A0AAE0CE99_9CHLO|nr:hypothetical protein CYMTET_37943 [Cymbomonas tetramitiformis]